MDYGRIIYLHPDMPSAAKLLTPKRRLHVAEQLPYRVSFFINSSHPVGQIMFDQSIRCASANDAENVYSADEAHVCSFVLSLRKHYKRIGSSQQAYCTSTPRSST